MLERAVIKRKKHSVCHRSCEHSANVEGRRRRKKKCGRLFEYYFVSKQLAPGYQHINSSERYAGDEVASCYVT